MTTWKAGLTFRIAPNHTIRPVQPNSFSHLGRTGDILLHVEMKGAESCAGQRDALRDAECALIDILLFGILCTREQLLHTNKTTTHNQHAPYLIDCPSVDAGYETENHFWIVPVLLTF